MWTYILSFLGFFTTIWVLFKYVILIDLRLDANTFKTIYKVCEGQSRFILQEEFVSEVKPPIVYVAICWFKDAPIFILNHVERLLTGGWGSGKDSLCYITCFRWDYKRLKKFLVIKIKEMQLLEGISVEIILPNYTDKIGILYKESYQEPLQPIEIWKDIDNEVANVFKDKQKKTSVLLYGNAGNGKTSFIKYLAIKYQVPIKIITFQPDFINHNIMQIFSQIESNCIVLLEDFDNYFDGRKNLLAESKFTFDMILNGLDGIYNNYENVVFIMTVNDINKVDSALKNRPSRFKYVRCFDNPNYELRRKLLPEEWVKDTEGLNLDQIIRIKEFGESGFTLEEAKNKLDIKEVEVLPINKEDIIFVCNLPK